MVFASFLPRLPELRNRIDVDLDGLGLLLALGVVGGLAASAVCGPLIARIGTRSTMTRGALGLSATLPVVGFAPNRWVFLAALIGLQFCDLLTDVAMNLRGSQLSARRSVPVMNRLHGL